MKLTILVCLSALNLQAQANDLAYRLTLNRFFGYDREMNDPHQYDSLMLCQNSAGEEGGQRDQLVECGEFTKDTDFSNQDFSRRRLIGLHVDWNGEAEVNFSGANLRGADLSGIYSDNSPVFKFDSADMTQITIRFAHLRHCSFTGANMTEAEAQNGNFSGSNFSMAKFDRANFQGSGIGESNFTNASFVGTNLTGVEAFYANFTRANLARAVMSSISAFGANFSNANLTAADLSQGEFSTARFAQADLRGANLFEANLAQTRLSLAIVDENTNFRRARFDKYTELPFSREEAFARGMICTYGCE